MKAINLRSFAPWALVLTLLPLSLAMASPPFAGGGPRGGFGGDLFFVERMAQKLDLSSEQRSQVDALMNQAREQARPYVKTLVQAHREMREATRGDNFDEAAVRAIATRQAQAMAEMSVLHARTRHAIGQLLTPEQRARMKHLGEHRRRGPDAANGDDAED